MAKKQLESVTMIGDSYNDNKNLIFQVTSTLTYNDANGYNINEAGLYLAASDGPGYNGPFFLYAKTTFPSLPKLEDSHFDFDWCLLF